MYQGVIKLPHFDNLFEEDYSDFEEDIMSSSLNPLVQEILGAPPIERNSGLIFLLHQLKENHYQSIPIDIELFTELLKQATDNFESNRSVVLLIVKHLINTFDDGFAFVHASGLIEFTRVLISQGVAQLSLVRTLKLLNNHSEWKEIEPLIRELIVNPTSISVQTVFGGDGRDGDRLRIRVIDAAMRLAGHGKLENLDYHMNIGRIVASIFQEIHDLEVQRREKIIQGQDLDNDIIFPVQQNQVQQILNKEKEAFKFLATMSSFDVHAFRIVVNECIDPSPMIRYSLFDNNVGICLRHMIRAKFGEGDEAQITLMNAGLEELLIHILMNGNNQSWAISFAAEVMNSNVGAEISKVLIERVAKSVNVKTEVRHSLLVAIANGINKKFILPSGILDLVSKVEILGELVELLNNTLTEENILKVLRSISIITGILIENQQTDLLDSQFSPHDLDEIIENLNSCGITNEQCLAEIELIKSKLSSQLDT